MGAVRRLKIPTGKLSHFAGATVPQGWLRCNGQAVSRVTYAALWVFMGSPNTGDGATTFNVPEIRGEYLRGLDEGRGVDVGRVLGSAQAGQMPSHDHGTGGQNTLGGVVNGAGIPGAIDVSVRDIVALVAEGGTDNGSENRVRNVAFPVCIKT